MPKELKVWAMICRLEIQNKVLISPWSEEGTNPRRGGMVGLEEKPDQIWRSIEFRNQPACPYLGLKTIPPPLSNNDITPSRDHCSGSVRIFFFLRIRILVSGLYGSGPTHLLAISNKNNCLKHNINNRKFSWRQIKCYWWPKGRNTSMYGED
jgi:hypothetical protein